MKTAISPSHGTKQIASLSVPAPKSKPITHRINKPKKPTLDPSKNQLFLYLRFSIRIILDDLVIEALRPSGGEDPLSDLLVLCLRVLRTRQPGPGQPCRLDPVLQMIGEHDEDADDCPFEI